MTEQRETTFISITSGGYSGSTVPPGGTVTIVARPQVHMVEPYKLFIPPHIAPDFTIEDVRVGTRSFFPMGQSLTAEQFSHGDGHLFKTEPILVGMDFLMVITNICGCPRTFRASWAAYLPRQVDSFVPAFEKQSLWDRIPGPLDMYDYVRNKTKDAVDKAEEVVRELKDRVEEKVTGKKPPPRQLPKSTKTPPNFGWDPYGDD